MASRVTYTKEEREAKRKERLALLDQAVEELTSSEAWAAWLKVRRMFHAYSWRNQLMISIQAPATMAVKGFRQWQELGRSVNKGAKAVWILAPSPYKTGKLLANGEEERRMAFKPVAVFAYEDTTQIEGAPVFAIEPPLADLEGDDQAPRLAFLADWLQNQAITVDLQSDCAPAHGFYAPARKEIGVRADLSANAKLKTLIHETAHHLVHVEWADNTWSYDLEEVIVESTAYAVCATIGLETAGYSAGYVATWQKDGPKPENLVQLVDTLATKIEGIMELGGEGSRDRITLEAEDNAVSIRS